MLQENCGVVGVAPREYTSEDVDVALLVYYALYALQHRGQESAGIAVHRGSDIQVVRNMGLVSEVFSRQTLKTLNGAVGIGHVRYSTAGVSEIENAQPLHINYKKGSLAIAHNGNLVNSEKLRIELEAGGDVFFSDSDTEVIAKLLVKELVKGADYVEAIRELMRRLIGSYSLTILIDDMLVAVRDPLGIKPLCLGMLDNMYLIVSESAAIDTVGGQLIRDILPGEIIAFEDGKMRAHRVYRPKNAAHCVFEYIYFARPDSIIDGRQVYDVRRKVGERLFEEHPVEADIVSPVPDSGITHAIGYAKKSGFTYMEGLVKNRYVWRTFIMPNQDMRDVAVNLKLNVVHSNVDGKHVVLIDDSIVRGTTTQHIVDSLRKGGAKSVHVRVGSPPIIAPCYLGVDIATREELIAANKSVEEIGEFIRSDSIGYVSIQGLVDSIGMSADNLCLGCLTGTYPVEIPGEKSKRIQLKLTQF